MLIKQPELVSIKENKVTLIKNFALLERKYDFNLLSKLLEENSLQVINKTGNGNLRDVFQVVTVNNCLEEFKTFSDFLRRLLKYERNEKDAVDLFFSFVSQIGNTHVDIEDVFIIGLEGKTIYRVYSNINEDYTIEKGDMIFIPKGLKHKVIVLKMKIVDLNLTQVLYYK